MMATAAQKPLALISAHLSLYPKAKPLYKVTVFQQKIVCDPIEDENGKSNKHLTFVVDFDNIIGCECMRGNAKDNIRAFLTVYSYSRKVSRSGKPQVSRQRTVLTLGFEIEENFEKNQEVALQWKKIINCLAKGKMITHPDEISSVDSFEQKQMLVLVNPFGGQGKALKLFQERVVPIFAEAGMQYTMKVTDYAGHAGEIVQHMKLDDWYAIIIVSGDGLIYEVVNGLMQRPDWSKAIQMPIGALPGGSGNALASAVGHQFGEEYQKNAILHSSFMVAKHQVHPLDLFAIDTCKGRRLYSFLAVAWGLISDVDIESEKYRSLGNARFTVGALSRIMALKKYHGRLSFLPVDKYVPYLKRSKSVQSEVADSANGSAPAILRSVSMVEPLPCGPQPSNGNQASGSSGSGHVTPTSRSSISESEEAVAEVEKKKVSSATTDSEEAHVVDGADAESRKRYGLSATSPLPTPLLNPLDEPVPSNWVTIEDDFITMLALNISHLSSDTMGYPETRMDDGFMWVGFSRGGISRMKLLQTFLDMNDGKIVSNEYTETIKCRAFRLEPITKDGIMTVDGERIECGPIQGQVIPSMARVLGNQDKTSQADL